MEIMSHLLCSHVDPINKLLIMGIPLLGRSQDFGDIIYWPLNLVRFAFFFAFDCQNGADDLICSRDVQKKGFFTERGSKNRLGGKQGFEVVECGLGFVCPLEGIRLLHESVQR